MGPIKRVKSLITPREAVTDDERRAVAGRWQRRRAPVGGHDFPRDPRAEPEAAVCDMGTAVRSVGNAALVATRCRTVILHFGRRIRLAVTDIPRDTGPYFKRSTRIGDDLLDEQASQRPGPPRAGCDAERAPCASRKA